jgi:NADPH2:quinone reductase
MVIPAEQAVRLPDEVSFNQGAGLAIPYITAHGCLYLDGPIRGRTILVAGGAGAVGHAAIELAKFDGAHVITTVSSSEKAELARAAGADVVVNYRDADAVEQIRAAAPDGVDRVIEVALGANLDLNLAVLRPAGSIITYAAEPAGDPQLPVRRLMTDNITLRFVLVYNFTAAQINAAVAGVSEALAAGALTSLPETHFSLDDIAQAHLAVEDGVTGKVIVDID